MDHPSYGILYNNKNDAFNESFNDLKRMLYDIDEKDQF